MAGVDVVIFHHAPRDGDPPLVRLLAEARDRLLRHQTRLFRRAGARRVVVVAGRDGATPSAPRGESFGERLSRLVGEEHITRLIVMGSGAVPRLTLTDARNLVRAGSAAGRQGLTNNRYSSDVCAVSGAATLIDLPPLPSDNALPRWLEERAGFEVHDMSGRDRLALDLDTPLDLALLCLTRGIPVQLRRLARDNGLDVPHLEALRELAGDPRRELLIFGRSGSQTLGWLERNVRCRVRFLAEERGMRASSPMAIGGGSWPRAAHRPPRATLGRLLEERGPGRLAETLADLCDGAIVDSRVLMADRSGADESTWPTPSDRFASDLLRANEVADPWLRELTSSAARSSIPILLGAHTLVGPGIRLLLKRRGGSERPVGAL